MFFEGIRSERQLERVAADRLSVRWFVGYDHDEPVPDHSSLTRIRARYGLAIFERFFERVVEMCQESGRLWGEELFFDATKVQASAAVDSLVPRFYWKAKRHVEGLFEASSAAPGTGHPGGDAEANSSGIEATPQEGATLTQLRTGISAEAEANRATWRLLDHRRLDPDRPFGRDYRRLSDLRVSTTDPDATPTKRFNGDASKLGYHDHSAVDGGKARIILGVLVTPADVMENAPMLDMFRRIRFRWKVHPKRATGDTTYGTAENIKGLEDEGIQVYTSPPDFEDRTPFFAPSRFVHDAQRDEYLCPEGQPLRRAVVRASEQTVIYQGDAAVCKTCPVKAKCTESENGRQVRRSFHAEYCERVRGYHETAAYKKAMRKRQVWVEPLFGEAKEWHGLRRFRLRGLDNVNIQGLLVATGQNLKRLLNKRGWGRRPWPTGGTGWSSPAPSAAPLRP